MEIPGYRENMGYRPEQNRANFNGDGEDNDELIRAQMESARQQKIHEEVEASSIKSVASSIGTHTGGGIGSAAGIIIWGIGGAVAGAASSIMFEGGEHLLEAAQPYVDPIASEIAPYVSSVVEVGRIIGQQALPKPDSLVGTFAESIRPVVVDRSIDFAFRVKDIVVYNITSIGATVGGIVGYHRSRRPSEALGYKVALPVVVARNRLSGMSRFIPFRH